MSIKVNIIFTIEQAAALFRDAGLEVTQREMPFYFKTFRHNEVEKEMLLTWVVLNPRTNEYELLEPYFRKFIEQKKQEIFLQAEKLQIFKLFEK